MKIAIIGAGPSGLAAAYVLTKNGIDVDIFEKSNVVGGLAKSINILGQNVEYGPHFLNEKLNNDVKEIFDDIFTEQDFIKYDRVSRIYTDNSYLEYPPSLLNLIKNMGFVGTSLAFFSFLKIKIFPLENNHSVECFVKNSLGVYLYKKLFESYTEKLWGISCTQLDESYAKVLIGLGDLNLKKIINKFIIRGELNIFKKCIYPVDGMSMIWNKLHDKICLLGGKFEFNAQIKNFLIENEKINGLRMTDGSIKIYDDIICTVSETAILNFLPSFPQDLKDELDKARYRSVIFVYLKINNFVTIRDNVIYLYGKEFRSVRITNFSRFKNQDENNFIMLEYWLQEDDEIWQFRDNEIIELVKIDLSIFLASSSSEISEYEVIKIKNAYPIPDMQSSSRREKYNRFISKYKSIFLTGRANQKNFNYGMEEAMTEGIVVAKTILEKR